MAYFPWCKLISTWKDLHYILTFKRGIVVIVQLNALLFLYFSSKLFVDFLQERVRISKIQYDYTNSFFGGGGPVTGGSNKVST